MWSETVKIYITIAALLLLTAVLALGSERMIAFHARQWTINSVTIGGTV